MLIPRDGLPAPSQLRRVTGFCVLFRPTENRAGEHELASPVRYAQPGKGQSLRRTMGR